MITTEVLAAKINANIQARRPEGLVAGEVVAKFSASKHGGRDAGKAGNEGWAAYWHYPGTVLEFALEPAPTVYFASHLLFEVDCGDVLERDFDRLIVTMVDGLLTWDDFRREHN